MITQNQQTLINQSIPTWSDFHTHSPDRSRVVIYWLVICTLLIFAMIVLGGVTRLTHSGLSMVDWRPIMGIIPPLNEQEWQETFRQYQQFPEYQKVHSSMSLEAFKGIFFFEYAHRLLGRFTGLVFIIPLLFFWWRGNLTQSIRTRLIGIFLLGGAQGVLGWYMVQSGLVDEPRVSQYRLTAHLGLAVALYGYLIWTIAGLWLPKQNRQQASISWPTFYPVLLIATVYLMILSGGIVAGLKAGLGWNTFPLMGETFFPPGLYSMTPAWLSALENPTTVQFNHRILAYTVFTIATLLLIRVIRSETDVLLRRAVAGLYIALCCQVALGISTLLLFVPVSIAALHQACAIIVFSLVVVTGRIMVENSGRVNLISKKII